MKKLNVFHYKILLIVVEVAISIFILYTGSLFAGIFGLLCALYLIYSIYKAMKSDDAYKQMIIKDNDEREECWDTNKDQWQDKKIAGFSEIYQAWEKSLKDLGDITIGDNTIQSNSAKFSHAAFHAAYSFCQEKYGLQAVRNKQYAIYKNPLFFQCHL